MTKYNNRETIIDGFKFDSKAEGEYYTLLKEKLENGEISGFQQQPKFILQEAFDKNGKKFRRIDYIADFLVQHNDGSIEVIDVKGMETETFRLKMKLFEKKYPHKLTLMKKVIKFGGWITVDEYKRLKREEKKVKKC